jgi:hypothetical protein
VKQGAVTQTALVKLAVSSLLNYVLCKVFPHEFNLLIQNLAPLALMDCQAPSNAATKMRTA